MYIHIDPETLKQHPWIAVLIGLAGAVIAFFASTGFWKEYLMLRNLPCPVEITADNANLSPENPRKWAALTSGRWHHGLVVEEKRKAPECWFLGPVDNTQIPVTGWKKHTLIVIKCDGKVDSQALSLHSVTGMLVNVNDRLWGGGISRKITIAHDSPVMVLVAGAGPAKALQYAWIGTFFFLAFSIFTSYYLWLWSRKGETSRISGHISNSPH
ncbi:MAG: hypothetical protein AB2L14_34175 [Candidatus Xenobiia bacterium LiM19]